MIRRRGRSWRFRRRRSSTSSIGRPFQREGERGSFGDRARGHPVDSTAYNWW
jgi:hypothetical protein